MVHSPTLTVGDPAFRKVVANVERALRADDAIDRVGGARPRCLDLPRPAHSDREAGAARTPEEMVLAAGDLKRELARLGTPAVEVNVTGAAAMWSDFNESNREAMLLRADLLARDARHHAARVRLARRRRPAADAHDGRPGRRGRSALPRHEVLPISIWAMNFALMFALALGIDYALFVLQRFRATRSDPELSAVEATALTMDSAGTAVLFSGITVLISLTAVVLVPSPAFRSMSLGIGLTVVLVLAAALTLLPAALARLDARVDKLSLPWARHDQHGSARSAAWGERLWRRPLAYGAAAVAVSWRSRSPPRDRDLDAVDQGGAGRRTPRGSATARCRMPSGAAPRGRCRSSPRGRRPRRWRSLRERSGDREGSAAGRGG